MSILQGKGAETFPGSLLPRILVASLSAAVAMVAAVTVGRGTVGSPPVREEAPRGEPRVRRAEAGGPALGFPLARLVPPDAVAFLTIRNAPSFMERVSETGLARALGEKDVERFTRHIVENLPPDLARLRGIAVGFGKTLTPALSGELAVAVLRLGPALSKTEAVLLADVSGREKEARVFLAGFGAIFLAGGRIELVPVAGSQAFVLRAPGGTELAAWSLGDGLLAIGTGVEALTAALGRRAGALEGRSNGLDGSALFRASMGRASIARSSTADSSIPRSSTDGDADFRAFVNVDLALRGLYGESGAKLLARYGANGLRAAALTGRVGESVREALYLYAPGQRGALLHNLCGSGIDLDAAARLPAKTIVATFGAVDGRPLAREVSGLAQRTARQSRPTGLARVLLAVAGEPLDRAARGLRGKAAVAVWNAGRVGWFPVAALAMDVPDRPALEPDLRRLWQSLASGLGGALRVHKGRRAADPSGALDLYFIERPRLFMSSLGSPAYAFDGTTLVAGTTAITVRDALEESRGLRSDAKFTSLLAELPDGKSRLVYIDVPTLAERALEPYAPAALEALVPGARAWLDRSKVPPGPVVEPHLRPAGASAAEAPEGVRIDAVTPGGLPLVAAVAYRILSLRAVARRARSPRSPLPRPAAPRPRSPQPP
ncbi:MAG: hypothetical protein ACYTFI_23785, partial [Planctomycetota bacterium]